jgi:hypothetical protein
VAPQRGQDRLDHGRKRGIIEGPDNNEMQLTKRAANAGRVSQLISVFAGPDASRR